MARRTLHRWIVCYEVNLHIGVVVAQPLFWSILSQSKHHLIDDPEQTEESIFYELYNASPVQTWEYLMIFGCLFLGFVIVMIIRL